MSEPIVYIELTGVENCFNRGEGINVSLFVLGLHGIEIERKVRALDIREC